MAGEMSADYPSAPGQIPASAPVVCFGEMLLRLSSAQGVPLARATELSMHVGGAEANVAVALASLGRPARMLTVLPDNPLGQAARNALMSAGVSAQCATLRQGRMGLYFNEPASGPIPGRVTYDRSNSAFASADAALLDIDGALAGAALLHMSGITPALGPGGVALARAVQKTAIATGVPICFDGNFRANLWDAWDADPRPILCDLVGNARIMIGNHRDISLLLGETFSGDGPDRRREAAEAAFAVFPNLELIASTARHVETGQIHRLSARVDRRHDHCQTEEVRIEGVIDRIGTGDAFAAGLLLRYLDGGSVQDMAQAALTLAVMKHGFIGDTIAVSRTELEGFDLGASDIRR